MTRPTPTQGAQSEAARVPRVSDDQFETDLAVATDALRKGVSFPLKRCAYALDLRDAHDAKAQARDERDEAIARADALQARLTEAEQRAATAERRGFEAGLAKAAENRRAIAKGCNMEGRGHDECQWPHCPCKVYEDPRALAPAVPQEGETTP